MRSVYTVLFCFCCLLATAPAQAQNSDTLPQFNLIRTPVSPAFTLLDAAPTAVERPNTPADLAISILSKTTGLTQIPTEYAMELSPYWLASHPNLTWQADTARTVWESIQRTATVSLGTAGIGDSLAPVTGLALGFRTALFSGETSDRSKTTLRAMQQQLARNAATFFEATQTARAVADSIFQAKLVLYASDPTALEAAAQEHEQTISKINAATVNTFTQENVQNFVLDRQGFLLELAFGGVWRFPNDIADSGKFARFGVWITPAYQWTDWSIVGVGRMLSDKVGDSTHTTVDAGLRLIYTADEYGLSIEAVGRTFTWDNAPDSEWRIAAVLDYEIKDGTWLTTTFGRDYQGASQGSFLAKLGLSFNLSSQRYVVNQ